MGSICSGSSSSSVSDPSKDPQQPLSSDRYKKNSHGSRKYSQTTAQQQQQQAAAAAAWKGVPQRTSMGIGLGVAMMMQQAAQLTAASHQLQRNLEIDQQLASLQTDVRKAKAEGMLWQLSVTIQSPIQAEPSPSSTVVSTLTTSLLLKSHQISNCRHSRCREYIFPVLSNYFFPPLSPPHLYCTVTIITDSSGNNLLLSHTHVRVLWTGGAVSVMKGGNSDEINWASFIPQSSPSLYALPLA